VSALALLVPVENVRAGDVLRRPSGVEQIVTRVEGPYEDGDLVLVYATYEQGSYENKARDRSGFNVRRVAQGRDPVLAVEQSWRPLKPGDLVPIARRGDLDGLREAQHDLQDGSLPL
jgi:hypothetical protein